MQFVLASESARRVDLLRHAGYDFETRKSGFPEVTLEHPKATVETNARGKALAVADGDTITLAADTVVYLPELPAGERVLGQAGDEEGVRRMLGDLQGRAHEVYSGVAVARGNEIIVRHAVSRVKLRSLEKAEVEAYVGLGEGVGKAGGYAIQGLAGAFVEWVVGDYSNIVGLPLSLTIRMLERFGVRWY
ncbi:MAG TPA: Maf family protein [Rubrobacteraceae bacterium]|nr:Maf family protein [Rubrobacteraceae bacterium]